MLAGVKSADEGGATPEVPEYDRRIGIRRERHVESRLRGVMRRSEPDAGAQVIANVREAAANRMRSYGAAVTVDHTAMPLADAVRTAHPDGIDVLLDLVSDGDGFADLAALVITGGTAVTTRYVADTGTLTSAGITGINFALQPSSDLLDPLPMTS
jgi:hypothetical protein